MKNFETSVIINASQERVWEVLTDFENYAAWNPFISKINGKPEEGTKIKNTMNLEGMKPQVFTPTILKLEKNREFRWLGHMFIKGLFDGEHYFVLEESDHGSTKVIHGENFSGILVRPLLKMIGEKTVSGFQIMNEALKKRVETLES
ncbi:MAG: SRPBCC domain-containing protein [Bacteroidetes bacterium]|nr:MAG: SRPBCC domain-containing protein [Bacteroidota bacterium]